LTPARLFRHICPGLDGRFYATSYDRRRVDSRSID
jgi:hypothetical protein